MSEVGNKIQSGGLVKFHKNLCSYSIVIYFVLFHSIAAFGVTNEVVLPDDAAAQVREASVPVTQETFADIGIDSIKGYYMPSPGVITVSEHHDVTVGPASAMLKEKTAIILHKDGTEIRWSLAPMLSKLSLNPIENIKNLEWMLEYRF